jgi:hypothetical protein
MLNGLLRHRLASQPSIDHPSFSSESAARMSSTFLTRKEIVRNFQETGKHEIEI